MGIARRHLSYRERLGKRAIIRMRVRACTSRHESTAKRDDLLPRIISCKPVSGQCDKRMPLEELGSVQLGVTTRSQHQYQYATAAALSDLI